MVMHQKLNFLNLVVGVNVYGKRTLKMIAIVLLLQVYFTQGDGSTKYTVLKGLSTSATSGNYTAKSMMNCATYLTDVSASKAVHPMATYSKNTSVCQVVTSLPENIILTDSSENNYVIWDVTSCTKVNDVYREYIDMNLPGFDKCYTPKLNIDACIEYCRTSCSGFKSIEYNYGSTSSDGGYCYCKFITKQSFLDQGLTLKPLAKYSFYEMLC